MERNVYGHDLGGAGRGLPTIYASPNQQNLKKVGLDQFLVTGSCELGLI